MASHHRRQKYPIENNKKNDKSKVIAISSLLNPVTNGNVMNTGSYKANRSDSNSRAYMEYDVSYGSRNFGSNSISASSSSSRQRHTAYQLTEQLRSNSCPQVTYGVEINGYAAPPSPSLTSSSRKFSCRVCGKKYMTAAHLTRHEATHTGIKPYECPYPGCGSRFSRNDNCMQHFKTHSNPKGKTSRRMQRLQGDGK